MSLDPSLKTKGSLAGKRSVYTRAERVLQMLAEKKLDPKADKATSLPKMRVRA